ncbi:MAG TPA: hypothetical protein VFS37_07905 [Conexibacter sp.]|nr:hypothetical protein [Conexibacter sp.]
MPGAHIEELTVADEPATWAALGFAVEGDVCRVGSVPIRLAGRDAGRGLVAWTLRGAASDQLDGLPTRTLVIHASVGGIDDQSSVEAATADAPPHPNGVTALDHVVAITPALDRTIAALQAAGLDLRRVREEPTPAGAPRQAFFRLGDAILEVVQAPEEAMARSGGPDGPAFFWGLAFKVADLRATVAAIGAERCSGPRPAVQPGRRIATLRRSAGLALPVALMTE